MDRSKKLVILLLVLALVFSVASVVIGLSTPVNQNSSGDHPDFGGQVGLNVENSKTIGGNSDGS